MNEAMIEMTLRTVVELLVRKDYVAVERLTKGRRLSASDIENQINDYGVTLVSPPMTAFAQLDVVPIRGRKPHAYSIRFPLYSEEEGESDLEVQATFTEDAEGQLMEVELDNILVP